MDMPETVFCYAEGEAGRWEAYCLTFDLAVRGATFDDVQRKLHDQIVLYLEGVAAVPAADRRRLLRRRAPVWVWVQAFGRLLRGAVSGRDGKERHEFSFPIPRAVAA